MTMQQLLASAKAFSEPTRVRLIWALRSRELCVCELCDALDVAQSTLSTHLQYLRQTGLVKTRQDGKWVYYELTRDFRQVAKAFFKLHGEEVEADPRLRKDASRLESRLQQRDDGACCVGFSQPSPKRRQRPASA
jgi:ArsR family transcriptional regulator